MVGPWHRHQPKAQIIIVEACCSIQEAALGQERIPPREDTSRNSESGAMDLAREQVLRKGSSRTLGQSKGRGSPW